MPVTDDSYTERPSATVATTDEVWAIVVAGGLGVRFGVRKQHELLNGVSVLDRSIEAARARCSGVVVVVPADEDRDGDRWKVDVVVAGGDTRSASVRAGLAALPASASVVVIHDAARPLASPVLFDRVIAAVRAGVDGAIPVIPVSDTVRQLAASPAPSVVLDRSVLVAVQTPQAFSVSALRAAHASERHATDDAALVEVAGGRVELVEGSIHNIKITHPTDLVVAAALLEAGVVAGVVATGLDEASGGSRD